MTGRKNDIVAIDLFCGCGGLTKGLTDAGIQVVKGIDIDGSAKDTYEKNNPGSVFVESDIRKLSVEEIMNGVDRMGKKLLLAGCAPCQPFSRMVADSRYDRRKSLIQAFAEFIYKLRPEYLLVENVSGFRKSNNVHRVRFIRTLKKCGYYFDERVINAADYGIPQNRRRYVLLGSNTTPVKIPAGSYGRNRMRWRTVRDTIKKYPRIAAGEHHKSVLNHSAPFLSDVNLARIRSTPSDGGSRDDVPEAMRLKCHTVHSGHNDVYGRMYWDKPSPTLTCKCISFSNGRFGHPEQDRAISVREAASLQTFPDDYIFHSCRTTNALHVGNAVPVLLAKELGKVFRHTATNCTDG